MLFFSSPQWAAGPEEELQTGSANGTQTAGGEWCFSFFFFFYQEAGPRAEGRIIPWCLWFKSRGYSAFRNQLWQIWPSHVISPLVVNLFIFIPKEFRLAFFFPHHLLSLRCLSFRGGGWLCIRSRKQMHVCITQRCFTAVPFEVKLSPFSSESIYLLCCPLSWWC